MDQMENTVQLFQFGTPGSWFQLELHLPGHLPQPIGILLLDQDRDILHSRLQPEWWSSLGDQEEAEIWQEFGEDLQRWASAQGAADMIDWLASSASHSVRIGESQPIRFQDPQRTLDLLYNEHIAALCNRASPRTLWRSGQLFASSTRQLLPWLATAAGLALAWQGTRVYGKLHSSKPAIPIQLATASPLPFDADPKYRITMPTLDADWNPSVELGALPLKTVRAKASVRRTLKVLPVSARPRIRERVQAVPPAFLVVNATIPEMPLPTAMAPPPKYKNRNTFLRMIGYVSTPFRLLGARSHDVGESERGEEELVSR
jgi:hypothetical protein